MDDDQQLVERALSDRSAFAELYRRHVEPVYSFAYRRSGSREVAEEATSATFEKALRSIKARVLYMPSETDLYFPITDARS